MNRNANKKSFHSGWDSPTFPWIGLILIAAGLSACAPKIYLKDRHTVMEDEAAGEWPDFEKDLLEKVQSSSPAPIQKVETSSKKKRLYQVLQGELVSEERPL